MHWFGPRFLGKQMDTFVAIKGERIIGFVIVQYDGDAAGTFDWAFAEPLTDKENREDFADLIDAALDHVEGQGLHPYFYFGFATSSPAEVTSNRRTRSGPRSNLSSTVGVSTTDRIRR